MNLTDLKPHWIAPSNWAYKDRPYYIGLSFLCPHCSPELPEHGPTRRQRLAVSFWPHIDPTGVRAEMEAKYPGWYHKVGEPHARISGETFETITLEPSIGFESFGHWHGRITNGRIA